MIREDKIALILIIVFGALIIQHTFRSDFPVVADEFYYAVLAKEMVENAYRIPWGFPAVLEGHPFEKPELPYYLSALMYRLLGDIGLRLLSPLFGIATLALIYHAGKRLYSPRAGLIALLVVFGTPIFFFNSTALYMEVPSAFMLLSALYLSIRAFQIPYGKDKFRAIAVAGIVSGLAFLTKETTLVLLGAFIVYYFITHKNNYEIVGISVIGLSIFSMHMLRDYIWYGNPVLPLFPSLFGWGPLDEIGYGVYRSVGGYTDWATLYVDYFVLAVLIPFAIYYNLKKQPRYSLPLILFFMVLVMFLFVPIRDSRYIIALVPSMALLTGNMIDTTLKRKNMLSVVLLTLIVMSIPFTMILARPRGELDSKADLYGWIDENTSGDAVFMDVYPWELYYHTGRSGVFVSFFCCGDMWNYWEDPERLMNLRDRVDYIVVVKGYLGERESMLKRKVWASIPLAAVEFMEDHNSFEKRYENKDFIVYEVLK